ncbi:MAG TPA: hypothetical protein VNR70_15045 [Steroidobacteraceae bacterium]|nr:hypothetical protein [Steroidobacteraceae bacterium]
MQFDYSRIWPYVIAVLAVLLIYRRFRRNFGRQRVSPIRMRVRIGILLVLGCTLLPVAMQAGQFLAAQIVGVLAGIGLGVWGARQTRYRSYDGQLHYVPHTYTGVAVSLLFIGRLVYRLVELYSMNQSSGPLIANPGFGASGFGPSGFGPPSMMRSPLTVGLLFVVIGYYVCYYSMVLWKSKRISPEELEVVTTSAAA